MKIVGLITEYNPFHNGHKYHLEKALEITESDAAIVIMSGDFVQRGTPAIMSKHLRAESALKGGASVVLELPSCYASGSAEYFASGAVSILHSLNCVDSICFGSECGDISKLYKIAEILVSEPEEYQLLLQKYLKAGNAFPLARQKALADYTTESELADVLSKPNNTLAIEYLKALIRLKSPITAYTISRIESNYHDDALSETYSSATAIRNVLGATTPAFESLVPQVPDFSLDTLKTSYNKKLPIEADDFSLLLKYKLLTETKDSLRRYADVSTELANRIINQRNAFESWSQFCNLLKTKEITFTRISRILLHILLGITQKQMDDYKDSDFAGYAKILGFSKKDTNILSIMKASSTIPLITKLGNEYDLSDSFSQMLANDIFASDLYESVVADKFKSIFINEYQKQIVIL